MKKHIKELMSMRYALLQKETRLQSPVEDNYSTTTYRQKKNRYEVKRRALDKQINSLTAAIAALENVI